MLGCGITSARSSVIFLFLACFTVSPAATFNAELFSDAAESVYRWLSELHVNLTHSKLLSRDLGQLQDVNIDDVYPKTLTATMADHIKSSLAAKRNALSEIVEYLETATTTYEWSDELNLNTTHPLLMKNLDPEDSSSCLSPDARLGVPTRRNVSGIHLPLEVYEGYPQILNGLKWSSVVDQKFQENAETYPGLMWQYFAAQTGFMRVYPATSWVVPSTLIDLYDARLRPWYVQGSVPTKDMIILMDRSGSVHGQTFTIMKWAVKTLIDTLGENDFVNVAAFNSTTEWVNDCNYCQVNKTGEDEGDGLNKHPCTQPLVQATTSNKKLLYRAIDVLEDGGMASYSRALTFAYDAFKQFEGTRQPGEGSNCQKTIMLFSDGGTEWPEEVVRKFRADNYTRSVRIFTFAVGPHPIPTAVLKQMACSTGGRYAVITTKSSVRTMIQESYTSLLYPQPPPLSSQPYQYTSVYTSAVTDELTLSLTRPVYNDSDWANTSDLIGVAGIDVPLRSLRDLTPYQALGPNGYAFILNHNGFLVLHPALKKQLSYFSGPPHLDLLDLEEDSQRMWNIRKGMINAKHEDVEIEGQVKVDDNHWIPHNHIKYTYTPIPNTTYSLGLVYVRVRNLGQIIVQDQDTNVMTPLNASTMLIAPWPYCPHRRPPTLTQDLARLIEDIWKKEQGCRNSLVEGLLWSQTWTDRLIESWRREDHSPHDYFGRAVFTTFGLTRFYPENQKREVAAWQDPWHNVALRRGGMNQHVSVIPHHKGAFLSAPVFVKKNNREALAGVVGVNVTESRLREGLRNQMKNFDNNSYIFLLLDDGGFIVSATRETIHMDTLPRLQGLFIGELDYPLLDHLVELGVYQHDTHRDIQSLCPVGRKNNTSAGHRIPSLLAAILDLVKGILGMAEYLSCLIYSVALAFLSPGVEAWTDWGLTHLEGLESCIQERTVYYLTHAPQSSHTGVLKCSNHTARFWSERIPNINAVLVGLEASDLGPECGVESTQPGVKPRRVEKIDACGYRSRYRHRPPYCMVNNVTVGELGCSSSNSLHNSSLLIILVTMVASRYVQ